MALLNNIKSTGRNPKDVRFPAPKEKNNIKSIEGDPKDEGKLSFPAPGVLVICASKSDEEVLKKVTDVLSEYKISYNVEYASAHREPDKVTKIVKGSGAKVFIAIAGMAAALPGFVASITDKPVIGVPVSSKLGGLDALLSIVQMPKGVPVAAVGIDNGQNAAHLAKRILDLQSER